MVPRPTESTLEALRLTVQPIEQQTTASNLDARSIAGLKRTLLNRIAELDAAQADAPLEGETAKTPGGG